MSQSQETRETGIDRHATILQWVAGYAAVFASLIIVHWPVLAFPPYDEFACVFLESVWLDENDFDFARLRDYELPFRRGGGPQIYLTSVVPSMFALLMRYGPGNPTNLILGHVGIVLFASLILILVYALVRRRLNGLDAGLVTAVLAAHPMFLAESEMLGIDVLLTAFALLAVLLAVRERTVQASIVAALVFWVKPTGLIVGVALATYYLLKLWVSPGPSRLRNRWSAGLASIAIVLVAEVLVLRWSGIAADLRHPVYETLVPYFPVMQICPDLPIACLASIAGFGVLLGVQFVRGIGRTSTLHTIRSILDREGAAVICAVVAAGVLYGIFFEVRLPGPRYFLLPAACSAVLLGSIFAALPRAVLWVVCPVAVALNLVNAGGALYPSVDTLPCPRVGAIWERSLEYRKDHRATIALIDAVRERMGDAVVVAPHHLTHGMAMPAIGYSPVALDGYASSAYTRGNFPPVARMMQTRPREVIFVHVASLPGSVFSHIDIPPPEPGDEVLFSDDHTHPLVAYRKRLPESPAEYDQWCLEHLWYGREESLAKSHVPLLLRAELLDSVGRVDLADRLLRMRMERAPQDLGARLDLAEQMLLTSRPESARPIVESVLEETRDSRRALRLMARVHVESGETEAANAIWNSLLKASPDDADVHYWTGVFDSRAGRWEDAAASLARSIALDPWRANVFLELGIVRIRQGRLAEAIGALNEASRLSPYEASLQLLRASVLEKLGRLDESARALAAAGRLNPTLGSLTHPLPEPNDLLQRPSQRNTAGDEESSG